LPAGANRELIDRRRRAAEGILRAASVVKKRAVRGAGRRVAAAKTGSGKDQ
jgi:hypothetical protein